MKPISLPVSLAIALFSASVGTFVGWQIAMQTARHPPSPPPLPSIQEPREIPPQPTTPVLPKASSPEPTPPPAPEIAEAPADAELDFETILTALESMDLRIIPEKFLPELSIPAISSEGPPVLTDEVIELFALGATEVTRLNTALSTASDTLTAAEIESLTITEVSENEVTIELPPSGDVGDRVEQNLRQQVVAALGPTDGPLFLDLMKHSSGRYWGDYGRKGKRFTFSAIPKEDGRTLLRIEESRFNPDLGDYIDYMTKHVSLDADEHLAADFGLPGQRQDYIRELLPDHLKPFFTASDEEQGSGTRTVGSR